MAKIAKSSKLNSTKINPLWVFKFIYGNLMDCSKVILGKSNISMSLIFSHAFPKQPLNNFRSKKILNRKLHFLWSEKCTQCS